MFSKLQIGESSSGSPAFITESFTGAGFYREAEYVGGIWINSSGRTLTVIQTDLWHRIAGTAGNTIADLLMDTGSGYESLWDSTPANRPTLGFASGDDSLTQGGVPDTILIPSGAKLRMDILEVQSGQPEDIILQVSMR